MDKTKYMVRMGVSTFVVLVMFLIYLTYGVKQMVWAVEETLRRFFACTRLKCGCGIKVGCERRGLPATATCVPHCELQRATLAVAGRLQPR